jgi:Arginine decarboxylase (spermidine biosynthesis)
MTATTPILRPSPDRAEPNGAEPWTIESARALYNIEGWGIGFFDINSKGHVVVRPDSNRPERERSV